MKPCIVILALVLVVLSSCSPLLNNAKVGIQSGHWATMQSPLTGLCYETYEATPNGRNYIFTMSQIPCEKLR